MLSYPNFLLSKQNGPMKDFLDRSGQSLEEIDTTLPINASFIRVVDEFILALKRYGGCEKYLEKIEKWDRVQAGTCYWYESKPMKCGLQVLNHGDVWVNNMMFQFDPKDVLLIDFQLCFWGSPVYDLLLFIMLSVHDDFKVDHFDDLIEFYQQRIGESLTLLGYDGHIPSFEEFKVDFMEKGHVGEFYSHKKSRKFLGCKLLNKMHIFPFTAASFLAIIFFAKYSSKEEFTFEKLMRETDEVVLKKMFDSLFDDELVEKSTKAWLPFMDERGYLDTLIPKN